MRNVERDKAASAIPDAPDRREKGYMGHLLIIPRRSFSLFAGLSLFLSLVRMRARFARHQFSRALLDA